MVRDFYFEVRHSPGVSGRLGGRKERTGVPLKLVILTRLREGKSCILRSSQVFCCHVLYGSHDLMAISWFLCHGIA